MSRSIPQPDRAGPPHDLARLIDALDRHGVDYRLAAAMRELNARLRVEGMSDDEARTLPVQVDAAMLAGADISTWMTDAGGFDVLPGLFAADGRLVPYEELATRQTIIHGEGPRDPARAARPSQHGRD